MKTFEVYSLYDPTYRGRTLLATVVPETKNYLGDFSNALYGSGQAQAVPAKKRSKKSTSDSLLKLNED